MMMSNYVQCSECDSRSSCGLSRPSKPSFGCFAGIKEGKPAPLRIKATFAYLKGEDYYFISDGPINKIHELAARVPFIEFSENEKYPTFALPYGVTL
jgi:hypothetical protein